MATGSAPTVIWFEELGSQDVARVGGKNASLGELLRNLQSAGISVPPGFATSADAYRAFIKANKLEPVIARTVQAYRTRRIDLPQAGQALRSALLQGEFPEQLSAAVTAAYRTLSARFNVATTDVAVRSSATAEDLPAASFAGQLQSFLNVRGERALLEACRRCYASLFTDRAISYRKAKGFDHLQVALSIGVQKMVRADRGGARMMFSIDTETRSSAANSGCRPLSAPAMQRRCSTVSRRSPYRARRAKRAMSMRAQPTSRSRTWISPPSRRPVPRSC